MMRVHTIIWLLGLSACASAPVAEEPIPPKGPELSYEAPVPPFVEREARAAASAVAERANEWRPPGTFVVAVVADMNPSYGKTLYGRQVTKAARWLVDDLRPDLVLSAGDMVAGQKRGLDYDAMWDAFDRAFWSHLDAAGYPLYVSPGNHDGAAGRSYVQERAIYRRIWEPRMPDHGFAPGSNWPFYYAFEREGILFVALDATTVGPLSATQRDWVRRTLEDHPDARATVVFGHVPPMPFAVGREWEVLADAELEEIFETHAVDVVVTGHHHAYFPGKRGDTFFVGAAALGSGPRSLIGRSEESARGVTVITLHSSGEVHVEARIAPDFDRVVEHDSLPTRIDHGGRHLHRFDVEIERAEQ